MDIFDKNERFGKKLTKLDKYGEHGQKWTFWTKLNMDRI